MGEPPKGVWRLTGGLASDQDEEERSLPAGFGLSDVRVTLFDLVVDDLETVPYCGALDHLSSFKWEDSAPDGPDDLGVDFGVEEPISQVLCLLACLESHDV